MKKWFCSLIVFFVVFTALYAGGRKDNEEVEMDTLQSWDKSMDISGKSSGKYNILIKAKDLAGNEGIYGPFNMYIDPKSDLPVSNISSPAQESRVVGSVNVVGTCVDDDAVDYVEVRIDGSEDVHKAKGKEFWSYYINTQNMEEGVHTIEVWGVDINGVKGNPVVTRFNLDRQQPVTKVENKLPGDLVSGAITLTGIVEDGNGVDRLLYSLNEGETFNDVKIKYNKKTKQYYFNLYIDTLEMEDGPKVCWFKAVDSQGSVGIYTFLFFVDNTPPALEFFYPVTSEIVKLVEAEEKEESSEELEAEADTEEENTDTPAESPVAQEKAYPSVFSVAGKAFDKVGLASLSWTCGGETGEFEIYPGNQYWLKEFDLTALSKGYANVIITAKDLAGNVVTASKLITLDKSKDIPTVELVSPKPGMKFTGDGDFFISGFSYDKYGTTEIRYTIDGGEEKVITPSFGGFGVAEKILNSGQHSLSIYAVNNRGKKSIPVVVPFTTEGLAPIITFQNDKTILADYGPASNDSSQIKVQVPSGVQDVSIGYNGEALTPVRVKPGAKVVYINPPIGKKSAPGIYTIEVQASDLLGRVTRQDLVIRLVDANSSSGEEAFVWAKGNMTDDSSLLLLDGSYVAGVYQAKSGAEISKVEVKGATGFSAEVEGNVIKLFAGADGEYKNVYVKITDSNGETFSSPRLNINSDTAVPKVVLDNEKGTIFVGNSFILKGKVEDDAGISSVSYTLGADSAEPKALKRSFKKTLNFSSKDDGPILLTIKTVDKRGRIGYSHRLLYKDTKAPIVKMIQPLSGDKVNGSISSSFEVDELFAEVKAEYRSSSKKEWVEFPYNSLPNKIIGTAEEPISKGMQFRFTDPAGNSTIVNRYEFDIDNTSDVPTVDLHLPAENAVIYKDFVLSGMVFDDDAPAKVFYKVDDGSYSEVDIKNSFAIPMALSDFTDNEHTITVYAEDIYGVKSVPVKRKIRVSLEVPVSSVDAPIISETVKGLVSIKGKASDKNGIKKIEVSVDNGNTFNLAEGTTSWHFDVNTHVIDDGTHVVFVKATDNYDRESIYSTLVNIDNTPPVLQFEYPLQGSKVDDKLFVSGKTYDNISLEGVTLQLKSLDGNKVPSKLAKIKLDTELLVSKDLDISSLADGKYNLEISGVDKADNVTQVSLNFNVYRRKDKDRLEFLYPLNGKTVRGEFNVYGRIITDKEVENAVLFIDGNEVATAQVSPTDYIGFRLNPELITEGRHKLEIKAIVPGGSTIDSGKHEVTYESVGPWVTIDNFEMGDFAIERPYLYGHAGYIISDEEKERINSKDVTSEELRSYYGKRVDRVEISFDNGKTFEELKFSKKKGWKYRIETSYMTEGNHFLLVRAIMDNKEVATCRTIVKIDKTLPNITLITPGEGGRYNETIDFIGLASDDIELTNVTAALRKGDKSSYGIPKFIQGLHFEAGFWGASLWNIGFGLSFFENNVKVQFHYGQFLQSQYNVFYGKDEPMRYGGHIASLKLLANVVQIPFGYYFGPDWNWLHMTIGLGAQFSLFTLTQSKKVVTDKDGNIVIKSNPQILSALLIQLEFPRVKLYKQKYFSSFSFFTEGQLWFVPTDVSGNTQNKIKRFVPHISGGIRVDVF